MFSKILPVLGSVLAAETLIVDIHDATLPQQITVLTCQGLFNRDPEVAGSVYSIKDNDDTFWWDALYADKKESKDISIDDFVDLCLNSGLAKGYINYNPANDIEKIPEMITMAGVLDSIPFPGRDTVPKLKNGESLPLSYDIEIQWASLGPQGATEYIYDNYVNETSGLIFMDPGYDKFILFPKLVGTPNVGLVDFAVKTKRFVMYLALACTPFTSQHALMTKISGNNPWPKPVAVMGYNHDVVLFGGDVFESETKCTSTHNMGEVASEGFVNFSYFTLTPRITEPLKQINSQISTDFDMRKTYMSFIIGDGDNLMFVKGSRREWMIARRQYCADQVKANKTCAPLLWSLSPQLLHLAPDMMRWYYEQGQATGSDFFTLPPSGDLYSFPGQFVPESQANHVANMEEDCRLMGCSSSVHWEWFYEWNTAVENYFPRFSVNKIVTAFYATNVVFLIPTFPCLKWWCWLKNKFIVIGDSIVLFTQREWRGSNPSNAQILAGKDYLTAQQMADEINGYKPGTVGHLYCTSDGGFKAQDIYDLLPLLEDHVEIVNFNTLTAMALEANKIGLADQVEFDQFKDLGKVNFVQ